MVCRSTPGNSAITTIARTSSHLHDVQVLSLFHEVRAEAPRATDAPNVEEQRAFLSDAAERTAAIDDLPDRRRTDIRNRLIAALDTDVDGRTYYAWRNIEQRATFARAAMETHFATIATQHSCTPEQAEAAFNEMMHRDHRVNGEVPRAPEHVSFSTDNLPRDRGTRYALAMLHSHGPSVTRSPSVLRHAYDTIHNNSEHIANNPHLDPANQCPDCGQFAGTDHTCPEVTAADTLTNDALVAAANTAAALNADAAEHDWENCLDCIEDGSNLHEHHYNPSVASDAALSEADLAADEAEMEALYTRVQGFVPEETGTADRLADDFENDTDALAEWERELLYGPVSHEPAASPQPAPRPATVGWQIRRTLPTTADTEYEATHQIRFDENTSHWVTPEGHAYQDRDLAVRSAALAALDRELISAVRTELGSAAAAADHLRTVRSRLAVDAGQWRTADGTRFPRYEDAVLHDLYTRTSNQSVAPASQGPQNCGVCGQFMGEDHVCDPETVGERRAALGDNLADTPRPTRRTRAANRVDPADPADPATGEEPLADWEAELLGRDPQTSQTPVVPVVDQNSRTANTPTRRRNPMRSYRPDEDTVVRTMNVSAIRAALRETDTYTLDEVSVDLLDGLRVVDAYGTPGRLDVTVTGSMTVTNNGQRRTRTRDRYEVSVDGATDPNAEVPLPARTLRCTCPDYRENYDCRHLRVATEQVQALINQRDPVAIAPAAAMENVGTALRDEYDTSLAASQEARAEFAATSDTVSYGEDMSAFQSAWDEAKAHFDSGNTNLPYMYENATNGLGARDGGRSIGIEIEVDFPNDMTYTAKQQVAREIYEAGLSDSPQVRPWHWRARQTDVRGRSMGGGYTDNPNMWSVEFDRSVDDVGGQRGCEIVSPILYDTPETWRNLKTICDIVERHGGQVTPRTGLHINIGAADFDHTVGNHNRLIGIANAYEDVIVRAAHNPQSGPNHRGREYCRPMSMPAEGFTSIRQAQRSIDPQNYEGSSHRAMINLDHVPAEGAPIVSSTRVEVRIFDGSIDPGRIQANVKMSLGMVNAAVRGVDVPRDHERAGTHRTANVGGNGRMRRLTGEAWTNDTASFRTFADTLFSREEDKKQLTYAFAASRWQRS